MNSDLPQFGHAIMKEPMPPTRTHTTARANSSRLITFEGVPTTVNIHGNTEMIATIPATRHIMKTHALA
jgi:hypothetical protein